MEITNSTLTQLNKDIGKALEEVLASYGLTTGTQHISFNPSSKEGRLTLQLKDGTVDPSAVFKQHFIKASRSKRALLNKGNFTADSYGTISKDGKWKLTDLNSKSPKYFVIAEELATGKSYKMTVENWNLYNM